jgi:hypothetical protein
MNEEKLNQLLSKIEEYNGLRLTLCSDFSGIRCNGDKRYFNAVFNKRTSRLFYENRKLDALVKAKIIKAYEPNGVNRLAIFF